MSAKPPHPLECRERLSPRPWKNSGLSPTKDETLLTTVRGLFNRILKILGFLQLSSFLPKSLKGVFAKNERGYRLILLLSVASKRRKLLKTINTEERSVHTNILTTDRSNISSNQKRFFNRIKPIPPFIFREHSL